ncbi:hypothetical protein ROS62_25185 [Streptomyces sp. DSM 41972]|uniref:TPR domain-containing protein n=1 Tax=Streptomyces althioticus subsp. attaecolombicae TaxID=3075534 RepID=A0ABU3I8A7_9ACTN|nr:hypothetical protein [Streptomyces sp. DSM 41972]
MDGYYDLGSYGRPVTTTSPEAQLWFDRGLMWTYAFNHEEAVACYQKAADADAGCAMAHWGIAYALGPNYNKPWEAFDTEDLDRTVERTHAAVERAHRAAQARATPVERALVEALRARYPQDRPAQDCSVWNEPYADRMLAVYESAPGDPDVAALCADALMNLTPWQLWDLKTGRPADGARTLEAKEVLDGALATEAGATHPGVVHFYIHLMEMSPTPEAALTVADRLRGAAPDAGHLLHMPSHLEVLCGDYRRVVSDNTAAIAADEKYLQRAGAMNFYTLYRCHDHHFRIYGAMFAGQSEAALDAAARLEAAVPEKLLRVESPPMADWLEAFPAMRFHVLIRFGRWDDILALPFPDDPELYCVTTAMLHYARGVALGVKGDTAGADGGGRGSQRDATTVWNDCMQEKQCRSVVSRRGDSSSLSTPHSVEVLSGVRTCQTGSPEVSAPHHISCIPSSLRVGMEAASIPARGASVRLVRRSSRVTRGPGVHTRRHGRMLE